MISIRGVSKNYGAVCAVDHVSMDIAAGEFFSLLGPSGCGKTTLLRLLAGFDRPSGGEIYIDQQPMSRVPPHHRPVKMVFQNYAIFPHLNVRDNILYGLRKQRLSTSEADAVVARALDLIKLPGFQYRRPDQLSGGQRQRVALARALVCEPKVLLLDEPLGALDKKLREEMQIELRQLQRLVGITFVFVTHDQEEALAMSDRVAVMSLGRTLQIDSPVRLYERPTCREVAAFIGTMNFLDGVTTRLAHGLAEIEAPGAGLLRAAQFPAALRPGEAVTLAIRPEKVVVNFACRPDGPNALQGRLQSHSYFGDRSHFVVEVPGLAAPIVAAQQNSALTGLDPPADGAIAWVQLPEQAITVLRSPEASSVETPDDPTTTNQGRPQDVLEAQSQ